MISTKEYKGYKGSYDWSVWYEEYYGELMLGSDKIFFVSTDEDGIQEAFESAIDDYIALCERVESEDSIDNEKHIQQEQYFTNEFSLTEQEARKAAMFFLEHRIPVKNINTETEEVIIKFNICSVFVSKTLCVNGNELRLNEDDIEFI
jgi:predicted HicB family RNase H-like nuclease